MQLLLHLSLLFTSLFTPTISAIQEYQNVTSQLEETSDEIASRMSTALESQLVDWLSRAEADFAENMDQLERAKAESEEERKLRRNQAEQLIAHHRKEEERYMR